jgi:predicted NACHT family NTPase
VRSHEWIDRRSLALHEAVAAKLEAQPQLLDVARTNLQRWLSANTSAALREWWLLLEVTPLPALLALLRSPGDEATRLRQSSPFAGLLTQEERQAILNIYESRRA